MFQNFRRLWPQAGLVLLLAAGQPVLGADAFHWDVARAKSLQRAPAAAAPPERRPPRIARVTRAPFLSEREFLYFDGFSLHQSESPAPVGRDEKGSFTLEMVFQALRLSGEQILFSNVENRSGLRAMIVNGELRLEVFLRRRAGGRPSAFRVSAAGARPFTWHQLAVRGQERQGGYELQVFLDGAEVSRGRCLGCGVLEPGRGPATVGAHPGGGSGFEGYVQSVTLRDSADDVGRFRGLSLAVADGVEAFEREGAPLGGEARRFAAPFIEDGYRPGPLAEWRGSIYLALSKPMSPLLVAQLSGPGFKLQNLYALRTRPGRIMAEEATALAVNDAEILVAGSTGLRAYPLRADDPAYRLAYSDWLERNLTSLQAIESGVSASVPGPDHRPGDARPWRLLWLNQAGATAKLPEGEVLQLSRTPEGDLLAWLRERGGPKDAEGVRAWRIGLAGTEPARTQHYYVLPPQSDGRELGLAIREVSPGKVVLYTASLTKDGSTEIRRLTPWGGAGDVVTLRRVPGTVAHLGFDASESRLWLIPAQRGRGLVTAYQD
ncbi:MAG: hypothetical protein IT285_00095 [Bdellovibrionales bacterium]|nr:hypothetical protein [Bdellovibrionales bacterium]